MSLITPPEEVTGEDTTASEVTEVPSAEELKTICHEIKANYDFKVNVKPVTFNFKTKKDNDTGVSTKRDSLELPIPYPSVEGVVAILESGGKGLELLMDAMETVINNQARNLITDDLSIGALNFPVEQLSWEFIANLPKAERTGGGIPKEVWEAFAEDYVLVMQEAAGKTAEQAARAASILKGKFAAVKTNKPVLEMLTGQLSIYAENASRVNEFVNCVEFSINKADGLLNISDAELLESL